MKSTPETVFAFRYGRNKDVIDLIDADLNFVRLSKKVAFGPLDEDKLVNIFANFN
jgi:hypothetical protein